MQTYLTKSGELVTKQGLIDEIQALLNNIAHRDSKLQQTYLNKDIMEVLEFSELENIRDNLLEKSSNHIESNKDWLLGLVDKKP